MKTLKNILKSFISPSAWLEALKGTLTAPFEELYSYLPVRYKTIRESPWIDCTSSEPIHQMPTGVPFMVRFFDCKPKIHKVRHSDSRPAYATFERRIRRSPDSLIYVAICKRIDNGFELFFKDDSIILDCLWEGFEWQEIGHYSKDRETLVTTTKQAQDMAHNY